ncbi:TonB-dependent receptor [Maricurvus nonylphenolicus]|uniref:TonB-dependent receptor n=1 Tax=Maricurvus nonylphenolicus TaxID=1008307 RepID=UPI0036F1AC82
MTSNKLFKVSLLAAAVAASMSSSVLADDGFTLEEIVVTAQKREQSLQEVPIAVQAIDSDMLEQNSVVSISDIGNMTPGLSIGNAVQDGAEIAIRGIGTSVLGLGFDQSVPLYLDGVYLGRGFDLLGDMIDVQQIEVLKGPQGTLFGRNAAAGAINVTTAAPVDEVEGRLKVGVGREDLRTVQAMYNTPLTENLLLRVNGSLRKRDGWQENLDGGDDLYEQDQSTARAKLLWMAQEDLSVELTADYSNVDNTQGGYILEKASPGITTQDIDDKAAPSTTRLLDGTTAEPFVERKSHGLSAKVTWDLSDELTFTSISSYRKAEVDMQVGNGSLSLIPDAINGTTLNLPVLVDRFEIEADEYSQEFRLSGISDKADWFAGFNYYKSEGEQLEPLALPAIAMANIISMTPSALTGTYYDDSQKSLIDTESYSLFGDVIWHLTDKLNLTTGLRYSYDEKTSEFKPSQQAEATFFATVPDHFLNGKTKDSADWDDVSGRIVVDYQVDEDTMVYAGVSTGYKSGGFGSTVGVAAALAGEAFNPFDKETTTNYEAGVKMTTYDGRLRINMAAFFTEFENYQLQMADLNVPGTALDLSAPEAESHGVDLDIAFAATESLNLGLLVGYLETEYAKDVLTDAGEVAIPKGQDLLRAPRWTTTAVIDYVLPVADIGDLRFNTTYTYRTSQRLSNSTAASLTSATSGVGDPGVVITESDNESGSYGLLNARLSLLSADETWEVAVWGTNLTDKAYRDDDNSAVANGVLSALSAGTGVPMAVTSYTRNEPRMWGVDFTYNF